LVQDLEEIGQTTTPVGSLLSQFCHYNGRVLTEKANEKRFGMKGNDSPWLEVLFPE